MATLARPNWNFHTNALSRHCTSASCLSDFILEIFSVISSLKIKHECTISNKTCSFERSAGKKLLNTSNIFNCLCNILILELNKSFDAYAMHGQRAWKQYFSIFFELYGWSNLLSQCCVYVVCDKIRDKINASKLTLQNLCEVLCWLDKVVVPFTSSVLVATDRSEMHFRLNFEFYTLDLFSAVHMENIFDIVTDLPESADLLKTINVSMVRTQRTSRLFLTLRDVLNSRLLHAGASTSQVLYIYMTCLQAMGILQADRGVMEIVKSPIVDYLRMRADTVRCVVDLLTTQNGSPFIQDIPQQRDGFLNMHRDQLYFLPREAGKHVRQTCESHDILTEMVQIYGSKDLLVKEYSNLISKKFLVSSNYDFDAEVRQLELLKLRFGDSMMRSCVVMLNDVVESKRIRNTLDETVCMSHCTSVCSFDVLVISLKFWPAISEEGFKLHDAIHNCLNEFSNFYTELKNPRKLCLKPSLGYADVEINFESGDTRIYTVSTFHANLILHFSDKDTWSLCRLALVLDIDPSILKSKIVLWVNNGVLTELYSDATDVSYILSKYPPESSDPSSNNESLSDVLHTPSYTVNDSNGMQLFKAFVVGMLTQFESLPLERIHENLKMFAAHGDNPYQHTKSQLNQFLQSLTDEGCLEYSSGVFSLKHI